MRGAGTSIAGNAVGPGIVVDTVKHLNRVVSIDPEARTAVVQPGVVHAILQRAAAPHGLRFGPDPSTHTRCTIGGMIGNNACGSRALGYGRTVDNVVALDVAWGPGATDVEARLGALVDEHLAHVRTEFGRFGRQVSGYSLEHLLPEHGRSVDRFLVGSEGTLALVREATVRLVEDDVDRLLVVLGYPSMVEAADAVPRCSPRPTAAWSPARGWTPGSSTWCGPGQRGPGAAGGRGLAVRRARRRRGRRWSPRSSPRRGALGHRLVTDAGRGRGAVADPRGRRRPGRPQPETPAYSGWEDAAVPPDRLGAWLRDFDELLQRARPRRRALRPLRRRLRARADRLPVPAGRRRLGDGLPRLPHRLRAQARATTAARCPASTATAGRAPSCCR